MSNNSVGNEIGKVQDMGSEKHHGVGHWKLQRISAIAMVPLVLWFVPSLLFILMSGYNDSIIWVQNPFNATGLVLLFGTLFFSFCFGVTGCY